MTYVPIIAPQAHTPSHQTRELADQLARVILDFEEAHPTVSSGEVREAAQLALQVSRKGQGLAPGVIVTAAVLVVLFVAVGVSLIATGTLDIGSSRVGITVLIGFMTAMFALVAMLRKGKL